MVYYTTLRCFNIYFLALSLSKSLCNSINLQVPRSSLLAVVGQVGVGKSSIVSAILGEMEKLYGHVTVRVSPVCAISQSRWLQEAENALFQSFSHIVKITNKAEPHHRRITVNIRPIIVVEIKNILLTLVWSRRTRKCRKSMRVKDRLCLWRLWDKRISLDMSFE